MIQITTSDNSIRVRDSKTNESIAIVKNADGIEFHQSLGGKQSKHINALQNKIKYFVTEGSNKKASYKQRFSKLATQLSKEDKVTTFQVLNNRLVLNED